VHSLLARLSVQRKLEPRFKGAYRLLYNGFSVLHLLAVFVIGRSVLDTHTFTFLSAPTIAAGLLAIKILGLVIIVLSLTKYDLGRFSGFTQLRTREYNCTNANEPLVRIGLSRWVRHPLYTGAFLLLWGGADSSFGFWTATLGSAYLIIGTRFEERKLTRFYGDAYRVYQEEVPMSFPFWRSAFRGGRF